MSGLVRKASILLGFAILFGAIYWFQMLSNNKKAPPKKPAVKQEIRQVETMTVQNEQVQTKLPIQGTLVAFDKIDLFTEVGGAMKQGARAFKVGNRFKKGEVMMEIDRQEAHLNLLGQRSNLLNAITQMMPDLKLDYPESFEQWNNYLQDFNVNEATKVFPDPITPQEKYFVASRNLTSQYYQIKSAEERLSKHTIYAPFTGVLTQTLVNSGAVVRVGQSLGTFMNTGTYELQATVPLSQLKYIKVGDQVSLSSGDVDGNWQGRVKRVSDFIDQNTQSIILFISVSGKNLREGMYMKGQLKASSIADALRIPRNFLVDNEAVYIAQGDTSLQLQLVTIISTDDNTAVVRGLEDGMKVVTSNTRNAYEGMPVRVQKEKPEEVQTLEPSNDDALSGRLPNS